MSVKDSLDNLKEAASYELSDALYENIVAHLDELLEASLQL